MSRLTIHLLLVLIMSSNPSIDTDYEGEDYEIKNSYIRDNVTAPFLVVSDVTCSCQ